MANATQETLLDVLAAIGNIVNAVASLVGVKGTNTTAISSPSNPLDVRLSDGAAATPGATAALQTSVGTTAHNDSAALLAASLSPGSHTAITPSDSTDVTAIASIGLLVTSIAGGAVLNVRGVTTSGTTVSYGPAVAGQYIWGRFSRVMASTTATVVGLAP